MTGNEKQAAFVAGLRKIAEATAAKNPTLADMRTLAKALVAEVRAKIAEGAESPIGGYMSNEGEVLIVEPRTEDPNLATTDILLRLRNEAKEGNIRAAALSDVVNKEIPDGSIVKCIQVHMEHIAGKAFISVVPADESISLADLLGVNGSALGMLGDPTQSKIFPRPN